MNILSLSNGELREESEPLNVLKLSSKTDLYYNNDVEEAKTSFSIKSRERLYQHILKNIINDDMKYPSQSFLIEGKTGSGKTTFLSRLYNDLRNNKEMEWHIPILLINEHLDIKSLEELLYKVIKPLQEQNIIREMPKDIDYDQMLHIIEQDLKRNDKKITLLIDDAGILSKFSLNERQKLREMLIQKNFIRIIFNCNIDNKETLAVFSDYKEPFYDFFRHVELGDLNKQGVEDLIKSTYGVDHDENIFNETIKLADRYGYNLSQVKMYISQVTKRHQSDQESSDFV